MTANALFYSKRYVKWMSMNHVFIIEYSTNTDRPRPTLTMAEPSVVLVFVRHTIGWLCWRYHNWNCGQTPLQHENCGLCHAAEQRHSQWKLNLNGEMGFCVRTLKCSVSSHWLNKTIFSIESCVAMRHQNAKATMEINILWTKTKSYWKKDVVVSVVDGARLHFLFNKLQYSDSIDWGSRSRSRKNRDDVNTTHFAPFKF